MSEHLRRPTVGFIGLGNMGRPMASRLAANGFPLVVHDVRRDVALEFAQNGVTCVESPRALAAQADIICVSLPGPNEAEVVFFGENGVESGARANSILIDFTTNSAALVRRMHAALADRGGTVLDAPVSGGVEAAKRGQLTVLVGGDVDTLAETRSILDNLATSVLYVGPIGAASICKALHNCAVFCTNLAMIECLTAGVKAGVDAAKLIDVFQKSGIGRNLDLQVAMPATLFRGQFQPPRFAMTTAHKDMELAMELARDVQVPMRLAEYCAADMAEAIRRGWGDQDNTMFLTLQEKRAGVQVRVNSESA